MTCEAGARDARFLSYGSRAWTHRIMRLLG